MDEEGRCDSCGLRWRYFCSAVSFMAVAGSPFEQLQQHGMRTAKLTKIVRQNDASLKPVVEHLSAKEIYAAVAGLQARGRVIEIPMSMSGCTALRKVTSRSQKVRW